MTKNEPSKNAPESPAQPPDLAAELETLKEQLKAAEAAREEYLGLAQRARADLENYQKRTQRDLATERRYAQMPLAFDLLAPLDNLARATQAAQQAGDKGALAQGVSMVLTQLLDMLRRHGITPIEAEGKLLDPNQHQAVMQVPKEGVEPLTVLQVLEQGFLLHDRVLRPARVIVAAAPESTEEQPAQG